MHQIMGSVSAHFASDRCNDFGYEALVNWEQLPGGWNWTEVAAVATDSRDNVFVFNRGEHPMIVFDRNGKFLSSWGEGIFARPHGLTIGPDDSIYCTDDLDHTVRKFTPDGTLLMTLGISGRPSDTGATSVDYRSILRAGPPFNFPTNVALAPSGEIFVTDGYGNSCVHKFTADGRLLKSWGVPGSGPGQFCLPHGIAIDRLGNVFVADRENSRVHIFSPDGQFIDQLSDVARPCQVAFDTKGNLWVAELGYTAGMWPGTSAPSTDSTGGRISAYDSGGKLIIRFGGGKDPTAPGDFFAPHDIRFDSQGSFYVAEVVMSAGGNRGLVAPTCHSLQKFVSAECTQ